MLCSSGAVATVVASGLTPGDLYRPAHQQVLGAMLGLARVGDPVDAVTVAEELRRSQLLDDIGGAPALLELQAATPAVSNVGRYIKIIRDTAVLRRMIVVGSDIAELAYAQPDDVRAAVADATAKMTELGGAGIANRFRDRLVRGSDAAIALTPPDALVAGVLFMPSVAVLYGAPKAGKSVLALDLALHVAAGRPRWFGRDLTAGRVLYVTGEGVGGLAGRVAAWLKHHTVEHIDGIDWLTVAPNLLEPGDVETLVALVGELAPELVVIDTLARSMLGGDENTARDMGAVVNAAERVRDAGGSCVLLVHHVGKNIEAGMRGSSALLGAVDTTIEVTGDQHAIRVKVTAQKDAPADDPWWCRLQAVDGSVVPVHVAMSEMASTFAGEALAALRELSAVDGEWVSRSRWASVFVDVPPRTLARAIGSLQDDGLVDRSQRGRVALFRVAHVAVADDGREAAP
jgi:hypothetical protein